MDIVVLLDGFHADLLPLTPTVKELWDKGTSGTSESVYPTVTGAAAASIQTSLPVGDHGVTSFVKKEGDIIDSGDIPRPSFYEILWRNGKNIFLENVPLTYPPKIGGDLITSWLTPSENITDFAYPTDLVNRYQLKNYPIGVRHSCEFFLDRMKHKKELISQVVEKGYDMCFFWIQATDAVQHFDSSGVWEEGTAANSVFREVDDLVRILVEGLSESDNLILTSDHGFKKYDGAFCINDWLLQEGFLKESSKGRKLKQMGEIQKESGQKNFETSYLNVGKLGRILWNSPLKIILRPLKEFAEDKLSLVASSKVKVDMEKSEAYCFATYDKGIRLTEKGRRSGAMGKIIDGMSNLPVETATREEMFPKGEKLEDLPDIFVSSDRWHIEKGIHGEPFNENEIYAHEREGFFIGHGKNFDSASVECSILDIAPTLLKLQNTQVPDYMRGDALAE